MEIIDLFPKTIAVGQMDSVGPEKALQLSKYLDSVKHAQNGEAGGFSTDEQILDKNEFFEVKNEIIARAEYFTKNFFGHVYNGLRIVNSWSNTVEKAENIPIHRHVNSYISGVFYLTYGSPLTFYDVTSSQFSVLPTCSDLGKYPRSWSTYTIEPKPGLLVLFPSTMYHLVSTSNDNIKRYSVAFNIYPVGKIGEQTNILTL